MARVNLPKAQTGKWGSAAQSAKTIWKWLSGASKKAKKKSITKGKVKGKGKKKTNIKKHPVLDQTLFPRVSLRGIGSTAVAIPKSIKKHPFRWANVAALTYLLTKKDKTSQGVDVESTDQLPGGGDYITIPEKNKNPKIERTGGSVYGYQGRKVPSMKTGGGLRKVNGKWIRS